MLLDGPGFFRLSFHLTLLSYCNCLQANAQL